MEYKIYVEKQTRNENYPEEIKNFTRGGMAYYGNDPAPQEFRIERVLEVILTEEEFKKVKTEVIKAFE